MYIYTLANTRKVQIYLHFHLLENVIVTLENDVIIYTNNVDIKHVISMSSCVMNGTLVTAVQQ